MIEGALLVVVWVIASIAAHATLGEEAALRRKHAREERDAARRRARVRVQDEEV